MSNDITKYVIGCDVSKYEVEFNDYTKKITSIWNPDNVIKPAHIDFVIQRVSYGIHQDQFVNELYEQVKKISIRGAYHYFTSGLGWKVQLDTILTAVKNKDYHFFAIDYEKIYNNLNATSFAEMMELAKQLKLATGKKVILYFNADVYQNYMKPYNADAVINDFCVWFAMYPWKIFVDFDKKPSLLPKNIANCKLWQFGGDASKLIFGYGEGKNYGSPATSMDLSVWYGSLDEMKVWAGVDDIPTPNPIPDPIPLPNSARYTGNVLPTTTFGLKIRSLPVTGTQIGLLNHDDYFEADKFENNWFHLTFPKDGWISSIYTKYIDNDKITIPDPIPQNKPAIPGPFYLLSHQEVGEGWFWPDGKLDEYPAIIPKIKGGSGFVHLSGDGQTSITQKPKTGFMKSLRDIMNDIQWKQEWQQDFGWHNSGSIGTVREIVCAHNKIWITKINSDGFYEYDVYYNTDTPPNLNTEFDQYRQGVITVDYKFDHDSTGGVINTDNRIPYLAIANDRTEKLRIDPKYLKSLLSLPVQCKIKTDGSNVNIRQIPVNGNIVGIYKNGEIITVIAVTKVDNKVWLQTELGFVASWLTDLDI